MKQWLGFLLQWSCKKSSSLRMICFYTVWLLLDRCLNRFESIDLWPWMLLDWSENQSLKFSYLLLRSPKGSSRSIEVFRGPWLSVPIFLVVSMCSLGKSIFLESGSVCCTSLRYAADWFPSLRESIFVASGGVCFPSLFRVMPSLHRFWMSTFFFFLHRSFRIIAIIITLS